MKRLSVLAVAPFLLTGCGVPSAVVMTTYAVDGVTYVSSGKTLTGHAVSAATDKDCSILFGITRGELCKDKEIADEPEQRSASFRVPEDAPAETPVSTAQKEPVKPTVQKEPAKLAIFDPPFFDFDFETVPASVVDAEDTEEVEEVEEVAEQPVPNPAAGAEPVVETKPVAEKQPAAKTPAKDKQKWTLVLGSFAEYRRAVELALKVKPEAGVLTANVVDGKLQYLVSTPPLKRDQAEGRKSNIADLKLESVTLMPVCPPREQKDGCVPLDRTIAIRKADQSRTR